MNKLIMTVSGPIECRAGYGEMARDFVRHIIDIDRYDVKLISLPWGGCPMNALDPVKDAKIISLILGPPFQLSRQPEVHVHIGVPNEAQPLGKFSILYTAGIETTLCAPEWIEGCNRMDAIWTISEHSKRTFETTVIQKKDQAGNLVETMQITKPIAVLHNCVHTDVFNVIPTNKLAPLIREQFANIKESFCFLFVGHWLQGNIGEDRKNVGLLVKLFCDTFKDTPKSKRPALILKTSGAGFSVLDREDVLSKINQIRGMFGANCPNVYLLHGELTEEEMNSLYNHPKIKTHISLHHGEGFGRTLLEATQSGKPLIASGWSGTMDFLNPEEAILIGGELRNVSPSAVWPGVIMAESQWFYPDENMTKNAMQYIVKQYDSFKKKSEVLAKKNAKAFSYDAILARTTALLDQYVPAFELPPELVLPKLNLPQLKKLQKVAND